MKNSKTANIKLTLYGKQLELNLSVPLKPVKPTRMLPVLQNITNKFVQIGVEALVGENESISCQAGCGACCSQPVPLAEFEAYQITELVENLPEPRRTAIKQKFADACDQLEKIDWFNRMENAFKSTSSKDETRKLGLEYFQENIPCPFLEDQSCSIHPQRPLACREYLVTSPAENCKNPTAETVTHINVKFKVSDIVRRIWKTSNLANIDFVPMINSLNWAKTHPDKFAKKRGEEWLMDFFKHLTKSDIPTK